MYTCLPASSAAEKCSACRCGGVAITTASMEAVLQQAPVIGVTRGAWNARLRALEIARIDSAKAAISVLGHARIWFSSSVPRSPAPMTPTRMRSAAPSTSAGPAARVPASPVATLPIKLRRESIFECSQFWTLGGADGANESRCRLYRRVVQCCMIGLRNDRELSGGDLHSIRVNKRWRLVFRWDGSRGEAAGVYLDDHSYL